MSEWGQAGMILMVMTEEAIPIQRPSPFRTVQSSIEFQSTVVDRALGVAAIGCGHFVHHDAHVINRWSPSVTSQS